MERDVEGFLAELTKLTEKYGVELGGCGCCGSPFLMDADSGGDLGERVTYVDARYTNK